MNRKIHQDKAVQKIAKPNSPLLNLDWLPCIQLVLTIFKIKYYKLKKFHLISYHLKLDMTMIPLAF